MTATFTKETNGTTVMVAFRREFIIELEENITTGYNWNLMPNPAIIILSTSFENYDKQALEGSGIRRFMLAAIEKGSFHLDFLLKRLWEDDELFTDRLRIMVQTNSESDS